MAITGSGFNLKQLTIPVTTDSGDHDVFAHYVPKDEAMLSLVEGVPVMALCGKIWIPYRDPEKYQVCPTCKEIMEQI